jgi:hypothetical protein
MRICGTACVTIAVLTLGQLGCAGDTGDDEPPQQRISNDFGLAFSPIYSAFDPEHVYRVPVVPQGGVAIDHWDIIDASGAVRKDVADLTPDSNFGGVMLTIRKAGDYYLLARAGKQAGCAKLHITDGTPEIWRTGEARYNNSIMLTRIVPSNEMPTLPQDISCKNCHGDGASFLSVQHTPQQTGGYSDEELIGIFTQGLKPTPPDVNLPADCSPYAWSMAKTPVPPPLFAYFHTWDASEDEKLGIAQYLRSLPPQSQGEIDFGGLMRSADD